MASLTPRTFKRKSQTLSWLNKQRFMAGSLNNNNNQSPYPINIKSGDVEEHNNHEHSSAASHPVPRWYSDSSSSLSASTTDSENDNNNDQNVNEKKCLICLRKPWRKPVQLPCQLPSRHVFCKVCIENWFIQSRTCPKCRYSIPNDFTPKVLNDDEINQLFNTGSFLPCPNYEKGCHFRGANLESIDLHESQCLYAAVKCPFAGCSLIVYRGQLNSHVESCIFAKAIYWSSWLPSHRIDPPSGCENNNNNENKNKMLKRKWLSEAESSVADLIMLPNNTTAVVCFHGQILNLANNPSKLATVLWQSRVQLPKSVSRGRTRVCHATYDYITNRIYFTVCPVEEGIFWVDLRAVEEASLNVNKPGAELKVLVAPPRRPTSESHSSVKVRQYWGISAIPQLQVLACCHREPNTIGFWSASRYDGDMASGHILGEISFSSFFASIERPFLPFRCAAYVAMSSPGADDEEIAWHITMAVDDIKNSRLHLVGLVAHQHDEEPASDMLEFEEKYEEVLAWQGVQKGSVKSPDGLHFDPDGKLIVADSGNRRVQIFAATGGLQEQPKRSLTARRRSNSDLDRWRCVWSSNGSNAQGRYHPDSPTWCSMKVNAVVAPLDPKTNRPFIMAGLWDDEDVVCFQ